MNTETKQVGHTPGELWRDDDGFIAQGKEEDYKTVIDARLLIDDDGTLIDNLLTAYNNTYAKGINPEAVPDLLEAAKLFYELCNSANVPGNDDLDQLFAAIQKANKQ